MPPNGWPGRATEGGVAWAVLALVVSFQDWQFIRNDPAH